MSVSPTFASLDGGNQKFIHHLILVSKYSPGITMYIAGIQVSYVQM